MQRTGIVGLCLVVASLIGVIAAASASATFIEEPPEYGQCLPKPFNGVGNWKDAGCTVAGGPGAKDHRYEWYPGFGQDWAQDPPRLITRPKFTSTIKRGTLAVLEVGHLETVVCAGATAKGEITGPKTVGNVVAVFTGCTEAAGNGCQSDGKPPGTVITNTLQGELGIIKEYPLTPIKDKVGLYLFFEALEFECVGIPVEVRGSVIHPIAANAMKAAATEQFSGKAGEQVPESFELLGKSEQRPAFVASLLAPEHILQTSIAARRFEESSLSLTIIQKNDMKVEVSSIN
jgi:hypothetical protein